MKLTFCRNFVRAPAPNQLTNQSKIQLIHRGHITHFTPRSIVVTKTVEVDVPTVSLTYKGNIDERQIQAGNPYQKPWAINWCYQIWAES